MAFSFPEIDFGRIIEGASSLGQAYLDFETKRTQDKLQEKAAEVQLAKLRAEQSTAQAIGAAQREVLSLHPELAAPSILFGGGNVDPGGALTAFYKGATGNVYVDPDSPGAISTAPTAVPDAEGDQLSLLLILAGAFLLLR